MGLHASLIFLVFYIVCSVCIFTKAIHVASKAQCRQAHDILHKKNSIKVDFLLMLNPNLHLDFTWQRKHFSSSFDCNVMFCKNDEINELFLIKKRGQRH